MRSKFGNALPAAPTPPSESPAESTATAAPPGENAPATLQALLNIPSEQVFNAGADASGESASKHEAVRGASDTRESAEHQSDVQDVTESLAAMIFPETAPVAASGQPSLPSVDETSRLEPLAVQAGSSNGEAEIDLQATGAEQSNRVRGIGTESSAVASELDALTRDANRVLAEVPSVQKVSGKDRDRERSRGRGLRRQQRRHKQAAPPVSGQFAVLDESDVSTFHEQLPELAMQFPFELDTFQKRAVLCLERREDVFVAAHTSAGKTVVAEYAVALAAQNAGRVCYTSPIKSLSNQKFRDFSKKFESVGIVTGDVSIRQESQCLIMTTEILRSMLYRSDDMLRSVDWVVFDETQYLNDPERGVVWETCILMLPPHVRMIMLSATVPNALEFAAWVGRTKQRRVSVVMTNHRPVPLQHSLLHLDTSADANRNNEAGDRSLKTTLLLRQGRRFLTENYTRAIHEPSSNDLAGPSSAPVGNPKPSRTGGSPRGGRSLSDTPQGRGRGRGRAHGSGLGRHYGASEADRTEDSTISSQARDGTRGGGGGRRGPAQAGRRAGGPKDKVKAGHGPASWSPLVRFLEKQALTPAIVFCFSKRKCAKAVESLAAVDLLPNASDKSRAHRIFEASMRKLQEADRNLPQVLAVREHLKKGIAAHHAGLLPIIKEVTEIMFSEGLIKVLFATETFAMGVNFPAKCVVFVGVRKHDGRSFRFLQPGEYTQMSGRAGRRGLDEVGNVFLYFPPDDRLPQEHELRDILTGTPLVLKSAFRLTYNMILNILRVDELRVEDMMRRSFSEAGGELKLKNINEAVSKMGEVLLRMDAFFDNQLDEDKLQKYSSAIVRIVELSQGILPKFLSSTRSFKSAFTRGRLVLVHRRIQNLFALGLVLAPHGNAKPRTSDRVRLLLVHQCLRPGSADGVESVLFEPYRCIAQSTSDSARSAARVRAEFPFFAVRGWKFEICDTVISDVVWFGKEIVAALPVSTMARELDPSILASGAVQRASIFLARKANEIQQCMRAQSRVARMKGGASLEGLSLNSASTELDLEGSESEFLPPINATETFSDAHDVESILHDWRERDGLLLSLIANGSSSNDIARAMWSLPSGRHGSTRDRLLSAYVKRERVRSQVLSLRATASARSMPDLLPEYRNRVRVLQEMHYVDDDGLSVLVKGRSGACEVATVDSVLLTEIILENTFAELDAAEVASLLSALVCHVKNKKMPGASQSAIRSGRQPRTGHGRKAIVDGEVARRLPVRETTHSGTKSSDRHDGIESTSASEGESRMKEGLQSPSQNNAAELDMHLAVALGQDGEVAGNALSSTDASKREESAVSIFSARYQNAKERMREAVRRFGTIQQSCGVDLEFEIGDGGGDFEDAMLRWGMTEVVLAWARGAPFEEVATMTDEQEGDVVVTVKRLAELLKDAMGVARAVGFDDLLTTLKQANELIRRDIIFSGSLYLD